MFLRIVIAFVGLSFALLYIGGDAHGRPLLTPHSVTGSGPSTDSARTHKINTDDVADTTPSMDVPDYNSDAKENEASLGGRESVCRWWTPETGRETDTLCSAFALRRLMGSDTLARALERAQQCAILHGTTCVLSHEVGLQVPAVMLWNSATSAMRMYLLPRVVPNSAGSATDARRVALARPPFDDDLARSRAPFVVSMNQTVEVDHVSTTTHARESEQLVDDDAYCMQMLQLTIPERCNEEL